MSTLDVPYLPGRGEAVGSPLGRYLPPIPPGMISAWLQQNIEPGGWVLDPFGASPNLAVEAAQAGYRVIIAVNNPVTRFILEMMTCAPGEADFQAALADLAASRKSDERLERHIQSLYETECRQCGVTIPVHAFLWERQAQIPYALIYSCKICSDDGEYPLLPADINRLATLPPPALHRARAIERVASIDDPTRADVEDALNCYLPRALYVIFTLINRLDSLPGTPSRRALLTALLLNVFDEGNTLWSHPSGRARPRQLAIPHHFREYNLWQSLENGVKLWAVHGRPAVELRIWPEQPSASGISIFQGRIRDLVPELTKIPIQGVLSAIPRPNQAFWTLCALWAGWLWGRDAVAPIRNVLNRRRYDWNWHTTALQITLNKLVASLEPETPFFELLPEIEPSYLCSVLLATESAKFNLKGAALRVDDDLAQLCWSSSIAKTPTSNLPAPTFCKSAIQNHLLERGEPSDYLHLSTVAATSLVSEHYFHANSTPEIVDSLAQLQSNIRRSFTDKTLLIHYGGSENSIETGLWWLRDSTTPTESLSDRVEMEVVRVLIKTPSTSLIEIDQALCNALPGLLTPPLDMIRFCLESYGAPDPADSRNWKLRPEDKPAIRRQEIKNLQLQLGEIGKRIGYQVSGELPVYWKEPDGSTVAVFYILASGLIGKVVFSTSEDPRQCILLLPGGRANLVSYKINHDPHLAQAVQIGWRLVKFRLLRKLGESLLLDQDTWQNQLGDDPLEYRSVHLDLFT